jgi:hypothetical protein
MPKTKATKKSASLAAWKTLNENQNPLVHMTPIPYKATGSRYGACGIRIDGNPAFIDAVLSRLKPLLDGENNVTRLELARQKVDGSGVGKQLDNKDDGAEVVYIRLHQRGREGAIASSVFDKHLHSATARFAEAKGL